MSATADATARPIQLRVANKTAYVWDVDDIATIRSQHRICGVLTGTLPHLSQQNLFLGVPLTLMPEETVLLVSTGAAVLVDDPTAHCTPTKEELGRWKAEWEERVRVQVGVAEGKERERVMGKGGENGKGGGGGEKSKANSEAAVRKRKEREEKKRRKMEEDAARRRAEGGELEEGASVPTDSQSQKVDEAVSASTSAPLDLFAPSTSTSKDAPTQTTPIDPSSSSSSTKLPLSATTTHPYTITIPAPSSELAWYNPDASSSSSVSKSTSPPTSSCTYTTIASAREAGIWDYPATLAERARCGVFKDLWKQGYFMGGGIKFGGEYLVYPGDPLRYHSHFAASVVESPIAKLRPMEIVAHGRLGTATKKSHLLCGWDDEKQEVSYLSIEWAGFG